MFQLPVFNLNARIWRNGNPTTNPPDVVSPVNLALGRRGGILLAKSSSGSINEGGMWGLFPPGTDIRDDKAPAGRDTCEVPAFSGRFYTVAWVDDAGSGFANEHRFAELLGLAPWPVPFPSPGGFVPPFEGIVGFANTGPGGGNAVSIYYNVPNGSAGTLLIAGSIPSVCMVAITDPHNTWSGGGAVSGYGPTGYPRYLLASVSIGNLVTGNSFVTVNVGAASCLAVTMWATQRTHLHVTGHNQGSSGPFTVSTVLPNTHTPLFMAAAYMGFGLSLPGPWPSDWNYDSSNLNTTFDPYTSAHVQCDGAWKLDTTISVKTVTVPYSIVGGEWWYGDMETFY